MVRVGDRVVPRLRNKTPSTAPMFIANVEACLTHASRRDRSLLTPHPGSVVEASFRDPLATSQGWSQIHPFSLTKHPTSNTSFMSAVISITQPHLACLRYSPNTSRIHFPFATSITFLYRQTRRLANTSLAICRSSSLSPIFTSLPSSNLICFVHIARLRPLIPAILSLYLFARHHTPSIPSCSDDLLPFTSLPSTHVSYSRHYSILSPSSPQKHHSCLFRA